MDMTGNMNIAWADIVPRGDGQRYRTDRDVSRSRVRTKKIKEEACPRPIHQPMPVGSLAYLADLSLHFGCGPREAMSRAIGWPTWFVIRKTQTKRKRLVEVQVWEVQP